MSCGVQALANWYQHSDFFCIYSPKRDDATGSLYWDISQLQREGYVEAVWIDSTEPDERYVLKSLTLTVPGHKFLAELSEKSAAGRLKRRLSDLGWTLVIAVLTSVVTTLVTLNLSYE